MQLSEEYIITKIFQFTKRPKKLSHKNAYNFECPICNEGKSAGRKKRGYYFLTPDYFYCHNCNKSWNTINWLKLVCNLTYKEIVEENSQYAISIPEIINLNNNKQEKKIVFSTLPEDSINLYDTQQIKYYETNRVVRVCLDFIKKRRLDTAVNKSKTLWLSLKDHYHKNRLCIPFYDEDNQIRFYQTRTILIEDMNEYPKYLSKLNADKRIFGINNIDPDLDQLFIFEGPIDSMFVKNGLAIAGVSLTNIQEEILQKYALYEQIWIPDNQYIDNTARKKTEEYINEGKKVFIWPSKFKEFKDLNDVCVKYKLDQVSPRFLIDNSFSGFEAQTRLKLI